jgi:xanthine/uracil/vitamin C permease (AzgA family)
VQASRRKRRQQTVKLAISVGIGLFIAFIGFIGIGIMAMAKRIPITL